MNIGKGITWLAFVVVLNLVSPQKPGNTVDAVRAWAGASSPSNQASEGTRGQRPLRTEPVRTVRVDAPSRGVGASGACGDWLGASARAACKASAAMESHAAAADRRWHAAR